MQYNGINEGTAMMVNNIEEQDFFLSHLNTDLDVLEYGCGESTLTIAPLVKSLTCFENKEAWAMEIKARVKAAGYTNVTILTVKENKEPSADYDDGTYEDFKNYVDAISAFPPHSFDVVFIDGRARVACAKACIPFLKPEGYIFIHDYRHPTEQYRRREYEVVEEFLLPVDQVFALGKLIPRPAQSLPALSADLLKIDENVCWYKNEVVDEMNRFYDIHLKDQQITKHFKPFTDLLNHARVKEILDKYGVHGDLIDIGCGTAMLSEFCKDHNYHGADLRHVVAGCAMRNYPQYFYRCCDVYNDSLYWLASFDMVVVNGLLDVMQHPIMILEKILSAMSYGSLLIIHRQEITTQGPTKTIVNGSYGSVTYHSIIERSHFEAVLQSYNCVVVDETVCGFTNWENGGSSFLIEKKNLF